MIEPPRGSHSPQKASHQLRSGRKGETKCGVHVVKPPPRHIIPSVLAPPPLQSCTPALSSCRHIHALLLNVGDGEGRKLWFLFFNEDEAGKLCKGKPFYCEVSGAACGRPGKGIVPDLPASSEGARARVRACRKLLLMDISSSEQLEAGLPVLYVVLTAVSSWLYLGA